MIGNRFIQVTELVPITVNTRVVPMTPCHKPYSICGHWGTWVRTNFFQKSDQGPYERTAQQFSVQTPKRGCNIYLTKLHGNLCHEVIID